MVRDCSRHFRKARHSKAILGCFRASDILSFQKPLTILFLTRARQIFVQDPKQLLSPSFDDAEFLGSKQPISDSHPPATTTSSTNDKQQDLNILFAQTTHLLVEVATILEQPASSDESGMRCRDVHVSIPNSNTPPNHSRQAIEGHQSLC